MLKDSNPPFWLPHPQDAGWEIQEMCKKFSSRVIPVNKIVKFRRPIFLRSPELEEYEDFHKKPTKVMEENFSDWRVPKKVVKNPLEYSPVTGLKLDCPPNYRSATLNPYTYGPIGPWEPQPQFWYDGKTSHKGPTWPVGNPNDYGFQQIEHHSREATDTLTAMEIERPERYIPGEIYKNKFPKDPIEDLSGIGGCTSVWVPKRIDTFNSKFDPETLPQQPLFADYVKQKEIEFKDKLIKEDLSIYKKTDNYEDLIKKHRFISGSPETTDFKAHRAENIGKLEQRHYELNKDFKNRCQKKEICKPIWRSENKCSCCNSKFKDQD